MNRNKLLVAIAQGEISRKFAAKQAGVSCRTINRWMLAVSIKRPQSRRAREKDKRALKERSRKQVLFMTRNEHPKVPAALLSLSTRTVSRLREKYAEDFEEMRLASGGE